MPNRSFYHEILTEHNLHPMHKHPLPEANVVLDGVDIMLDQIIGQDIEFARRRLRLFLRMIQGEADEAEIEELEEASALRDISHMPARVKCAVLGWHTLEEALDKV